jgi:hypothetical protein
LAEGRGFINALHVIFLNPFLHNEVLRKLNFLPVKFLEVLLCLCLKFIPQLLACQAVFDKK